MGNLENRNLILSNGSKGLKFKVSMAMWMALSLFNRHLTVSLHGEEEAGFRFNFLGSHQCITMASLLVSWKSSGNFILKCHHLHCGISVYEFEVDPSSS